MDYKSVEKSPEKSATKPATKLGDEIAIKETKPIVVQPEKQVVHQSYHRDVMEFLQQLSQKIKYQHANLPVSLTEEIDAFIRDHGNKHPETTKK